ncbi:hypothetical protein KP509_13G005600 [Ceratopteris richardii]|uniref:Uncharacterized protein n=1 Tax=Ceratopteris richardii TaxID=49495 RepID=A0A8T2TGB7_CERRI|nr:hypothetical protein KP509_13G005600 [Ceratopteris richardii]
MPDINWPEENHVCIGLCMQLDAVAKMSSDLLYEQLSEFMSEFVASSALDVRASPSMYASGFSVNFRFYDDSHQNLSLRVDCCQHHLRTRSTDHNFLRFSSVNTALWRSPLRS